MNGKLLERMCLSALAMVLAGCGCRNGSVEWDLTGSQDRMAKQSADASSASVVLLIPRSGQAITDKPYRELTGTVSGLAPGERLFCLAASEYGWHLQYPEMRVDQASGAVSHRNIRLATTGEWELHERCAFCEAEWAYESAEYVDSHPPSASSYLPYRDTAPLPPPLTPRQYRDYSRDVVHRQMRIEELAKRDRNRTRLRTLTDAFRRADDPAARSQQYLEVGLRYEEAGQYRVAECYYRLALRVAPDSTAAASARFRID